MNLNRIIISAAAFFCAVGASAIPAMPVKRTITQADGSQIEVTLTGDEYCHFYRTADGHIVTEGEDGNFRYTSIKPDGGFIVSNIIAHEAAERSEAEAKFLKETGTQMRLTAEGRRFKSQAKIPVAKASAFPNKGEVHGLIILAEFSDMPFSTPMIQSILHAQMNQENYTLGGATGSARDYFMDQSNGVFTPVFDVYGPVKLPGTMAAYGANKTGRADDNDAPQMVVDACNGLKSEIDFSKYDYDNDGDVDLVFVIYSGYNEAQGGGGNTIWPHAWDIYYGQKSLKLNGKNIRKYACTSELRGSEGQVIDGIGTFCHEFTHCLGLPDMYDSKYTGYVGLEDWDLMDKGSYNNDSRTPPYMSVYERSFIGWFTPKELSAPGLYTLRHLEDGYKITNPDNPDEYYTFENRQPVKWDAALPSHGLMVVHVDYDEMAWANNVVNSADGGNHAHLQIVPANGMLVDVSDAAFPGVVNNNKFTDTSIPTAQFWTGGYVGKPITGIRENEDGTVRINFCTFIPAPKALAATEVTGTTAVANWNAAENASNYKVICNAVVSGKKAYSHEIPEGGLILNPGEQIALPYQTFASNNFHTLHLGTVAESSAMNGLKVQLLDEEHKQVLQKSYTVRDYDKDEYWEMETIESGFITIANGTYDKPITIKSLDLYCGKVASDLKAGREPEISGEEQEVIVEGAEGTSAKISGLMASTEYLYSIVAYSEENDTESRPSNKVYFTTSDSSGIEDVTAAQGQIKFSSGNGQISISSDKDVTVRVITVSGIVADTIFVRSGSTASIRVNPGFYIVTATDCDRHSTHSQIMVK